MPFSSPQAFKPNVAPIALGAAGTVLTSNGTTAATPPTFQGVSVSSTFTTVAISSSGTYTPAAGGRVRLVNSGASALALTLALPTGATDGASVQIWFEVTGAGSFSVTLNSAYVIPGSSSLTHSFTVPTDTKTRFIVQYDSNLTQWEVVQYINDYVA